MLLKFVSKGIFTGLVLLALLFIVYPRQVRAEGTTPIDSSEGSTVQCTDLSNPECTKPPTLKLAEFWVIKGLYVTWAVGGFIFLFGLVAIGFRWLTSGGDQQKLEELKKQATYWALSIPIFFGGVPAINFVLKVFPVSQEATCTENLNLPAFQLIFTEACYPGSTGAPGTQNPFGRNCCNTVNDCPSTTGYACNVIDDTCQTGKSCSKK